MTATMSWAFKVSQSHCSLFQKLPSFLVSLAFFFTLHLLKKKEKGKKSRDMKLQ